MSRGEWISIHVGGAGVGLGSAFWELISLEHGISPDGVRADDLDFGASMFRETRQTFVPRSLFVDLEPNAIDGLKRGEMRRLFGADDLIAGKESAGGLFPNGTSSRALDLAMDRIRRLADECDALEGFMLFHSIAGGTGSGLASILHQELSIEYAKKVKHDYCLFPSQAMSTSAIEPYNAILAMRSLMEHVDVVLPMENQAILDSMHRHLSTYQRSQLSINRFIAQVASSLTASLRLDGALHVELNPFPYSMVPYPRLHFFVCSQIPIGHKEASLHKKLSLPELTLPLFHKGSSLIECDLQNGKYLMSLLYNRGDIKPKEVNQAMHKAQRLARFVDWAPTGFKAGICSHPPLSIAGGDLAQVSR